MAKQQRWILEFNSFRQWQKRVAGPLRQFLNEFAKEPPPKIPGMGGSNRSPRRAKKPGGR